MKKIYVLYNSENKATEFFSEIIGVYNTKEEATNKMMEEVENHKQNYNNKEYYNDEYADGYDTTTLMPSFDIAVISKSNDEFFNAFRISEYEIGDTAPIAFVVYHEANLPNPKECFKGDIFVSGDLDEAMNFIGCDSTDTYHAIEKGGFSPYFDELEQLDETDDYNYQFNEIIMSKDGYYFGWNIQEFNL